MNYACVSLTCYDGSSRTRVFQSVQYFTVVTLLFVGFVVDAFFRCVSVSAVSPFRVITGRIDEMRVHRLMRFIYGGMLWNGTRLKRSVLPAIANNVKHSVKACVCSILKKLMSVYRSECRWMFAMCVKFAVVLRLHCLKYSSVGVGSRRWMCAQSRIFRKLTGWSCQ